MQSVGFLHLILEKLCSIGEQLTIGGDTALFTVAYLYFSESGADAKAFTTCTVVSLVLMLGIIFKVVISFVLCNLLIFLCDFSCGEETFVILWEIVSHSMYFLHPVIYHNSHGWLF